MKAKSMKTTLLRVLAVVVVTLSVLFLLHYGFWLLLISLWNSDNIALELDDDNRPIIESLLPSEVNGEELPDIENAEKIEYWNSLRDDGIEITYNDQSGDRFTILKNYGRPMESLVSYIRKNGYIVFFRSTEFFVLAGKTAIPAAFFRCKHSLFEKNQTETCAEALPY